MIPTSFMIFGQLIRVVMSDDLYESEHALGLCLADENLIILQSPTRFSLDIIQRTFYHELFHIIFHHLGYPDHFEDEHLIEGLSGALHQVFVSSVFPPAEPAP